MGLLCWTKKMYCIVWGVMKKMRKKSTVRSLILLRLFPWEKRGEFLRRRNGARKTEQHARTALCGMEIPIVRRTG